MGQKRTQNAVDEAIGEYLAKFEAELLGKIDDQLTERLDTLNENEESFKRSVQEVNRSANTVRSRIDHFKNSITFYVIGYGLLSSMIGGFITFLLLWFFW